MITLYTKAGCGYCTLAKNYLNKHGFEFNEVRVDFDAEARAWLKEQGFKSIPQIFHNGKLLVEGGATELVRMSPLTLKEKIGDIDVGPNQL